MKTLRFGLVATIVAAATIANGAPAKDEHPQPSGATQPAKTAAKAERPETKLTKGMTANDVRALMGQPKEIQPMEAPGAKAEVWVYREWLGDTQQPVQIGSRPITVTSMTDGRTVTQKVGEEPIYKTERKTQYRVVSLLMFDGRYVVYKVTQEEQRSFE